MCYISLWLYVLLSLFHSIYGLSPTRSPKPLHVWRVCYIVHFLRVFYYNFHLNTVKGYGKFQEFSHGLETTNYGNLSLLVFLVYEHRRILKSDQHPS